MPDGVRASLLAAIGDSCGELLAQGGPDLEAIIGHALDSQTEAIAVRVAEIIQSERAKDRADLVMRSRRLDLEDAELRGAQPGA